MQLLKPPNARPRHLSKISPLSNAIPKTIARVMPKGHQLHRPRFEVLRSNTRSPRPLKISQYFLNLAHLQGLAQAIKQRQTKRVFLYGFTLHPDPTRLYLANSKRTKPIGLGFFIRSSQHPDLHTAVFNEV